MGGEDRRTGQRDVIPYAERATDYATMIVSKDPHYDVLFASVDFVSNFGDRIYEDLGDLGGMTKDLIPAALNQLTKGGKLFAAPLFADMEFFIYNKQDWTDAGLDPTKVPTTWAELYALAPKLNTGGRAANVTPWDTIGVPYWISMYNSLGGQLFNEDKTQVLFDNDKALKTWQTVEAGLQAAILRHRRCQRDRRRRHPSALQPEPRRIRDQHRRFLERDTRFGPGVQAQDQQRRHRRRRSCPASTRERPAASSCPRVSA